MQITIKLEDSNSCKECPLLTDLRATSEDINDFFCRFSGFIIGCDPERPAECIEENGE